MGLDITIYNLNEKDKSAHIGWSYSTIHILRRYACVMLGLPDNNDSESDPKARAAFPNLVWHSDAEGYYVGSLPSDYHGNDYEEWNERSRLWVGSVKGLYEELQKVSAHMIANKYEGEAKEVLQRLLQMFQDVNYNPEETYRYAYIIFS
jgi:hypothetical protein